MSVFEKIKGFGQMFRTLDKEMMKAFGKQTLNFVAKQAAKSHQGKKYKGEIINAKGEVECEVIIIPKSDIYTLGFGNVVKDKFELTTGKNKLEIQLLPNED